MSLRLLIKFIQYKFVVKRLVLLHVFQSFVYNTDDGDDLLDNVVITNISTAFNNMNKNKTKQSKTNQICVLDAIKIHH